MGIPQIPSVSTSVIDRTSAEVSVKGGRVPYLIGFSKFGKGTRYYTTPTELEYYLGKVNTNKYGLAMEFAKGNAINPEVILEVITSSGLTKLKENVGKILLDFGLGK